MTPKNRKEKLNQLILKNAANNPQLQQALNEWNSFTIGEYDTRSGPKAAEVFQKSAKEYQSGCVVLALIFYDLFLEFGEFPRKSLFEESLCGRFEHVSQMLEGEEKEVVNWFIAELYR